MTKDKSSGELETFRALYHFFLFLYHNMTGSWQCTKMLHNWRKFQRVTGFHNTFSKQKQELKAYIFILRQWSKIYPEKKDTDENHLLCLKNIL